MCMYVCVCGVCMCVCGVCMCMCVYVCVCVCMYVCACVCMCVYVVYVCVNLSLLPRRCKLPGKGPSSLWFTPLFAQRTIPPTYPPHSNKELLPPQPLEFDTSTEPILALLRDPGLLPG